MEVLMSQKVRKILANPDARKQLAHAVAQTTEQRAKAAATITIDGKTYRVATDRDEQPAR